MKISISFVEEGDGLKAPVGASAHRENYCERLMWGSSFGKMIAEALLSFEDTLHPEQISSCVFAIKYAHTEWESNRELLAKAQQAR